MAKGTLVGINVSDTDELRINKINSNFRMLFDKASNVTQVASKPDEDVSMATKKYVDDAIASLGNGMQTATSGVVNVVDKHEPGIDPITVRALECNGIVTVHVRNVKVTSTTRNYLCTLKKGYWPEDDVLGATVLLGDNSNSSLGLLKVDKHGNVFFNACNSFLNGEAFASISYVVS